ncbi:MAG: PDZ domain-containing protein [Clostridia bacterium]|nr:PDZ domain-containing protein [Clostridia bacterium]
MKYKTNIKRGAAILLALIFLLSCSVSAKGSVALPKTVLLGGMPFGVSLQTGELRVGGFDDVETESGICSPARDAGLMENDIIKKVNGKDIKSALDVTLEVKSSNGAAVSFELERGEEKLSLSVTPMLSTKTGELRIGLWLEDGTSGLGTVTFIKEDSGAFGGLGHGIVKTEGGELCGFKKAVVSAVTVTGVQKGKSGAPGELKGEFHPEHLGAVTKNTNSGVFGYMTSYPKGFEKREIGIAERDSIRNGGATIFSTVDGEGVCEYAVEITLLDEGKDENKNFLITVTDTSLVEKTGGIVRGMSGSPVVQDGKLIGAVTHVLVSDPCRGYGIFIDNMLSEIP